MLDILLDILAEIGDYFLDRWLHSGKKKKKQPHEKAAEEASA